jgi:FkbM family methyltransferase
VKPLSEIITIKVGDLSVLLDVDSRAGNQGGLRNFELWRAETYSSKEPDTLAWIDSFFKPGDVIYDIGANIGQYSLYAAKRLAGQCKVLAFEPEALNHAKLNRNIVLNGLVGTVVPYCLAVTERTALDLFYVKTFAPGAALHAMHRPVTQGEEPFAPQNQQGVMGVSLDDLTGPLGLPVPNHIKIDVDGIEAAIIRGARKTLADPALRTALVEVYFHGNVAGEIQEAFGREGFALHNAAQVAWKPGTAQNLIFVR